jgi:Na+/melibiose symporter-like transporter
MTKEQAAYFIEGLAAGLAAPSPVLARALYAVLAAQYGITARDLDAIREEIDSYLDQAEAKEAKSQ